MIKRPLSWVTIIAVMSLAIFAGIVFAWLNFLYAPVIADAAGVKYRIPVGSTYKMVASDLAKQHIIRQPVFFKLLFRMSRNTHQLKAGEYLFPKGSTPSTIISQIVNGTGMVYHSFTIIAGTTFRQVRANLNNNSEIVHASQPLTDAIIMTRLGNPHLNPEGQFYPDTYYFTEGTSDLILLKRAYQSMQEKISKAWVIHAPTIPFTTVYEAVIAASIIEKETGLTEERPIIAGVLINRLRKGMMLQFDPTVIYGMGLSYNGTIYRSSLLDKGNLYNSYVYKGLPPTPISMPSMSSINAVMHPEENNYLYFVAKGQGQGHHFSQTLPEHNAAVLELRKHYSGVFNTSVVKKYLVKSLNIN